MPPNYKKIQAGAAATGLYEAADTTAKSSQYDISHQYAMTAQNVENIGSITSSIADTIGVASQIYGKDEFAAEFELGKKAIGKKYGDVTEVTESGESFSDLNWLQKLFSEKHYKAGDAILSKGAVTGFGRGAQVGIKPDLSMYDEATNDPNKVPTVKDAISNLGLEDEYKASEGRREESSNAYDKLLSGVDYSKGDAARKNYLNKDEEDVDFDEWLDEMGFEE